MRIRWLMVLLGVASMSACSIDRVVFTPPDGALNLGDARPDAGQEAGDAIPDLPGSGGSAGSAGSGGAGVGGAGVGGAGVGGAGVGGAGTGGAGTGGAGTGGAGTGGAGTGGAGTGGTGAMGTGEGGAGATGTGGDATSGGTDAGSDAALDQGSRDAPAPTCGDGIRDPGEQCDDNNNLDGDGCQSDCTLGLRSYTCGYAMPGYECDNGRTSAMVMARDLNEAFTACADVQPPVYSDFCVVLATISPAPDDEQECLAITRPGCAPEWRPVRNCCNCMGTLTCPALPQP